ncbi:MAG: cohesin domain-containing protein [Candidatus Competibacterales bacterium]
MSKYAMAERFGWIGLLISLGLLALPSQGMPLVSLDTDPTNAGIQDTRHLVSESLTVDVVLWGIEAAAPLQGFSLDIAVDFGLFGGVDVELGPFFNGLPIIDDNSPEIDIDAVALGVSSASGSGVLATITFNQLQPGDLFLDLNDVTLTVGLGSATSVLTVEGVNDATVTVIATDVPLPATGLLLVWGLLALGQRLR